MSRCSVDDKYLDCQVILDLVSFHRRRLGVHTIAPSVELAANMLPVNGSCRIDIRTQSVPECAPRLPAGNDVYISETQLPEQAGSITAHYYTLQNVYGAFWYTRRA